MKRFYFFCVFLVAALLMCPVVSAQVASLDRVTKTETHTFELFPTNEGAIKSFPIKIESEGKIAGKITCQTEGTVPANYNHLVVILYQKNGPTLQTRDSIHFKNEASVSYSVNDSALNSWGKEFLFTARLNYAQARCNCKLDITFTESVPMEKVAPSVSVKKEAVTSKEEAAAPTIPTKRSTVPSRK